ncbi:hypothetical protein [Kitasatospora sp. NBC_00315]|uniref:hypothetical protein n=1 Tax=Kitasatospora sp. NBC_00315 TaxID=2975963 RepID=UPI003248C0BD
MPAPVSGRPLVAALDLRVIRALPIATVCFVLAAAGHLLASGGGVPLGAALLGWLLTFCAAVAGAGRERSLPAILGGLAGGQLGLHLLFQLGQPHAHANAAATGGPSGAGGMTGMAGMAGMDDMPGMGGTTAMPAVRSAAALHPHATGTAHAALWWHAPSLGLTPGMLVGHLAATVVAGWWLWRGESALWRLVRLGATRARAWVSPLRRVLRLLAALTRAGAAGGGGPRSRRAPGNRHRPPAGAVLRHSVVRRGPPVAEFAR